MSQQDGEIITKKMMFSAVANFTFKRFEIVLIACVQQFQDSGKPNELHVRTSAAVIYTRGSKETL